MIQASSGYTDVNGARLYYEVAGAGLPLIMLHGHLIDSGQWDDQVAAFARHYRVIRYDARGFGRSSQPPAPFVHYEDLRGLMDALDVEHAYLMGCSGGGATIIDFTLSYPARSDALILVGSSISGYVFPSEPPPLVLKVREAMAQKDVEAAIEYGLQLWTDGAGRRPEQVNPLARERTREMMRRLWSREQVEAEGRTLEHPAFGRLAELRTPTLAIVGEHDILPIHEIADHVVTHARGARKVIIADAGHHPNMEHPAEFNQIVLEFLDALEVSSQ